MMFHKIFIFLYSIQCSHYKSKLNIWIDRPLTIDQWKKPSETVQISWSNVSNPDRPKESKFEAFVTKCSQMLLGPSL